MFEDETIRIACPSCGFKNQFFVKEFESVTELRSRCEGCKASLKIESQGFRTHLDRITGELEAMRLSAAERRRSRAIRHGVIDFQI